MNATRGSSA